MDEPTGPYYVTLLRDARDYVRAKGDNPDLASRLGWAITTERERYERDKAALANGVAEVRHQTEPPADADAVGLALEATAREIYDGWKDEPGWVPWVTGGNSTKQDVARQRARDILASDPGIGHE